MKTITIIDGHRLLFFIGVTNRVKKRLKDNNCVPSSSCLKQKAKMTMFFMIIIVFYFSKGQRQGEKKDTEITNVVISMFERSWKRSQRRNNHKLSLSSIFHNSNDEEKDDIAVVFL